MPGHYMFFSSIFKNFLVASIFLRHIVAGSYYHRGHQTGEAVPSSLDFHPGLVSRNSFTEASPLLPINGDYALVSEQFASSPSLDDSDDIRSIIGAESDGCSSTATQLTNNMRRVKREKGICDATQGTKKPDPNTRPDQQQLGGQENDGKTTTSSKKSPSPPLPRPFRSGGADELCLSIGSYYRVCAPAYIESRVHFIILNIDQCRPCMSIPAIYSPFSPERYVKVHRTSDLNRQKVKGRLFITNQFRLHSYWPRL